MAYWDVLSIYCSPPLNELNTSLTWCYTKAREWHKLLLLYYYWWINNRRLIEESDLAWRFIPRFPEELPNKLDKVQCLHRQGIHSESVFRRYNGINVNLLGLQTPAREWHKLLLLNNPKNRPGLVKVLQLFGDPSIFIGKLKSPFV